jgi:predicted PurR-regulated permease PerM
MIPEIPPTVWDQLGVVVIFALLLSGMAWLMIKEFSKAVQKISDSYSKQAEDNNRQWQAYFDAKNEKNDLINEEVIEKLTTLAIEINKMIIAQDTHDTMVRTALDTMEKKRNKLSAAKVHHAAA